MLKVEADSLELAYAKASEKLGCSVTELEVEVIQTPSKGLFNLFFRKPAIIVARSTVITLVEESVEMREEQPSQTAPKAAKPERQELNDTILPQSFVTDQADEALDDETEYHYSEDADAVDESFFADAKSFDEIVEEVHDKVNALFRTICFDIDPVNVSMHDDDTILLEFTGKDAALLIGKEGYRYKALSYMLFNWINAEYQLQLRLEIAEFLKNQEESVGRYLVAVCENIDRDGRAQTKVLDGVLVQIALRELRSRYPDKYVAIRSTRDGSKFIIINDYNEY